MKPTGWHRHAFIPAKRRSTIGEHDATVITNPKPPRLGSWWLDKTSREAFNAAHAARFASRLTSQDLEPGR